MYYIHTLSSTYDIYTTSYVLISALPRLRTNQNSKHTANQNAIKAAYGTRNWAAGTRRYSVSILLY